MPLTVIAIFSLVLLIDRTNGTPQGFWETPPDECNCDMGTTIKVSKDDKHQEFRFASDGALTYENEIYTDVTSHTWLFKSKGDTLVAPLSNKAMNPSPNFDRIDDRGFFCTES